MPREQAGCFAGKKYSATDPWKGWGGPVGSVAISAYVKTSGLTAGGVKIKTYWQDGNGWIWSNNASSSKITGTTNWSRLEATGTAPAGAKRLTVLIQPVADGQGYYWVDSVEAKEIIE